MIVPWRDSEAAIHRAKTVSSLNLVASTALFVGGIVMALATGLTVVWIIPAFTASAFLLRLLEEFQAGSMSRENRIAARRQVFDAQQQAVIDAAGRLKVLNKMNLPASEYERLVCNLQNAEAMYVDSLACEQHTIL